MGALTPEWRVSASFVVQWEASEPLSSRAHFCCSQVPRLRRSVEMATALLTFVMSSSLPGRTDQRHAGRWDGMVDPK